LFDLRPFQHPTGNDMRQLTANVTPSVT
jgi:hypothetical protein